MVSFFAASAFRPEAKEEEEELDGERVAWEAELEEEEYEGEERWKAKRIYNGAWIERRRYGRK